MIARDPVHRPPTTWPPAATGGAWAERRSHADFGARLARLLLRPWLQTLVAGLVLWGALTWSTVLTHNIHLVPSVLAVGAFLGPVVFVAYVYDRAREVPVPTLLWCFVFGGVLGVAAASVLEYDTRIDLGALPTVYVGLIEESCKLAIPLVIFAVGRYRREADGLLFGVASGMGFAAFESMGYGLDALLASHGHIGRVEELLFLRSVLAPAGHAAWTGFVCAMLWRARLRPSAAATVAVSAAFFTAVILHALWDSANSVYAQVPIALVSFVLLGWRLHVARREPGEAPAAYFE